MTSDKVNLYKDHYQSQTKKTATTRSTMSADIPPPPPYSSLYPPQTTPTLTSPYGSIPSMTTANAMPTFPAFYHQSSIAASSGHPSQPQPPPPPQMIASPGTPLMAIHPSTIVPSPHPHQHHHQMYGTIGPNHYLPATAQPYGLYQTAVIPTAYGPMIAPVQFPPMSNSAAAAAAAMMLPTNTTSTTTTDAYFNPRAQHHSRAFEIEMARQAIPIPTFGHIPTINPGNMAMIYGMGNGNNGTMLVSKSLKKPFY